MNDEAKVFISVKSRPNKKSNKLDLDKYYTSYEDMKYCVNKVQEVLKSKGYNVSQYLEPSAGEGVFSNHLLDEGLDVIAIDIEPNNENIIKSDFLDYPINYLKDRCIIGNPPYGSRLNLTQKFFRKAINIGDYIAFILPISQLHNTQSMYEFDLIHSEDLGKLIFSKNKKVHSCLNIYVRPKEGLNKRKLSKLNDVTIIRQDNKNYSEIKEDIRMCYWGNGSAGKVLKENESYSGEYKLKIHNENIKQDVIELLNTIDWKQELNSTAMLRIKQYHIVDVLRKYIEGIS